MNTPNHLIWFQHHLRVTDNQSLQAAMQTQGRVIAVYCFDPRQFQKTSFGFLKTDRYRAKFMLEAVQNLQKNLKELNINLIIIQDKPEEALPHIINQYNINRVFLQHEWTSEEQKILSNVKAKTSVEWVATYDQFLYHPEDIPYQTFQKIPHVFTTFRKKVEQQAKPRPTVAKPNALAPTNYDENLPQQLPSLANLGLRNVVSDSRSAFPFSGGEDTAWQRIQQYFWENQQLKTYKKTRNGLLGEAYSSKLSAWLSLGCISPRSVYQEVKNFEREVVKNESTYWLIFELIWRDFFKYISLKHGNQLFQQAGIKGKKYTWHRDEEKLQRWIAGNTGQDFVDANMRELAATGFMSNRGRQNVASFWAKEWKQDWRIGAAYFESLLIDYDVHSNWGNWLYNSGVGNDPRDRKFNIPLQAKRYDPQQTYQQTWLGGQKELFADTY